MTSRPELMTPAYSLSTAVTTTTTTTVAQQNPGTSVVLSAQRPTVSNSDNTVLAGRTVTVKPPNTETYLQQMGLHPKGKQGFPHGFMPSQTFSRPEVPLEHSKPANAVASSEKQPQVTSSAPTCVVYSITSASGKTAGDAKLLHQQMKQSVSSRAQTIPTFSQPIPPVHMQHTQAQLIEKGQQLRTIGMHGQPPMMHLMGPPPLLMPNHIQHKSEKSGKTKLQKAEMPQPNEPMQRPPTAQSQKSTNEPQRPLSAHENQALFHEQIRNLVAKGFIPPGVVIPPQILQMYHRQQQQLALAEIEDKKCHKGHPPKEIVSPGIAHQPPSVFAASIASQSSNPHIKSPAVAQTAPSPHPVFSQPSTSQTRPSSPGLKKSPLSAHENQALFQEQIRNLVGKGFIPPGVAIPPQILQMYPRQQQQLALAEIEDKKGHKGHPPKEIVSPGIAHQPPGMFAASIASQSSNPHIKSPAVAQTAPSPYPVFSQPSTYQTRPSSPGLKRMNDKINQNCWPNESLIDARNEAQMSRPISVETAPSPKHWAYSGNQQPKLAHQQYMDSNSKAHLENVRLVEHKHQEMLRLQQEKQDLDTLQEIQRQDIQRRKEKFRQFMKSSNNVPPTSTATSQQSDHDRQTASVPGKPRSGHMLNNTESGPSVIDTRSLHRKSELREQREQSLFGSASGEIIQGIPAQGYPLGMLHPFLRQVSSLPMDHPHIPDSRPPSQGGSRSPPPRQAHQAVMKSPNIPGQSRQMPDPPPGKRYPVTWQGTLALKKDSCAVQMHFISGLNAHVQTALSQPMMITRRMSLEAPQLEGVLRRMQYDNGYCMLLALPCGSDHDDTIYQTRAMSTGFIQYLQQNKAAGIVNVADPGSQQPAYVVHIFPPCEFSYETLGRLGSELLHLVRDLSHLLVIITTVA